MTITDNPRPVADPDHAEDQSGDTSYEVHLDHEDQQQPGRQDQVYVDIPQGGRAELPVIPPGWRGWSNIRASLRRMAGWLAHAAAFHLVRLPKYVLLAVFWSAVGLARLLWRFWRWAYDMEQHGERVRAAERDDVTAYMSLMREADQHRRHRLPLFFGILIGLPAAAAVWWWIAPGWMLLLTAAVVVPILATAGRPADRRIISPAVVAPRFRKLSADIVLRAYYAAKLGDPDKPGQQLAFAAPMSRDGEGSRVAVDLPYGKGFADAVKAREAIASGLDVAVSQVFFSRDPSSNRRHVLWVADRDPLAVPAGRTPLLKLTPTDVWQPAPFGVDERGRKVTLELMWNSLLVGAQPRKGKTFAARLLALHAAMDPYVKLTVVDGRAAPDWRKFGLVADRTIFGHHHTRDGDPVDILVHTLRKLQQDIRTRYELLSELPVDVAPEGKLTRDLARRDPRLRVHLLVLEEIQEYLEIGDQAAAREIAMLLVSLVKIGPAGGLIVMTSTQKPAGIGAGEVGRLFNAYRDQHAVRFALRCANRHVSDAVLGGDAYSEGFDASSLPVGPQYKGVGILYGHADETQTVRTYLADGEDTERILTAARTLREQAGTLTGMAAGHTTTERPARDPLNDVLTVWAHIDRPALHWPDLAAQMAEHMPEAYADATGDELSALLRGYGVPSPVVSVAGDKGRGVRREHVEAAAARQQPGGNGDTGTPLVGSPNGATPAGS